MFPKIPLLDHGYLQVVEAWGSDERIIEAARMSTDKGFLGWEPGPCPVCIVSDTAQPNPECRACEGRGKHRGDAHLLRYLYNNKHSTPFEFAGLVIEIKAPIMVFREWHRHRTQSYSEQSARYTPLADENYLPSPERMLKGALSAGANKQAGTIKDAPVLDLDSALAWQLELAELYAHSERVYQSGLKRGVPKELARLALTVGRYTRMRASANLRNWLGFETLRQAPNAQEEIRVYGDALNSQLESFFPRTLSIFNSERCGT